jgi:hypothetical protein
MELMHVGENQMVMQFASEAHLVHLEDEELVDKTPASLGFSDILAVGYFGKVLVVLRPEEVLVQLPDDMARCLLESTAHVGAIKDNCVVMATEDAVVVCRIAIQNDVVAISDRQTVPLGVLVSFVGFIAYTPTLVLY